MNIKSLQLALPPISGRPVFANNHNIKTLREKVLPKVYDSAHKDIIFDNFVSLSTKKQKGFLERLFKNNPNSHKFPTVSEEGQFQVVNSLFNKSHGIRNDYRQRLEHDQTQKLQKALKMS